MAVAEAPITTRNARSKLLTGYHWRALQVDIHLSYRKKARTGQWVVRWYLGGKKYRKETIGVADDLLDADGLTVCPMIRPRPRRLPR
jgi:hypothetical protein